MKNTNPSDSDQFGADDILNKKLYDRLFNEYGNDVRSLNWGNKSSQEKRFEILASIGLFPQARVLDVGCGLGHFYAWLRQNHFPVMYTGIDITSVMIDFAKRTYPEGRFVESTVFDFETEGNKYDFVFASGIFYLRKNDPLQYMKKTLKKMFEISLVGIAFNSLSLWTDQSVA